MLQNWKLITVKQLQQKAYNQGVLEGYDKGKEDSTTVDLNAAKTAISSNTVTLVITATWDNASDANNANDTGFGDGTNDADWTLQIPVTVTAKQHIGA